MVSGSLSLLYFPLAFRGGRQGSGPNSPELWGDFPYVCLYVHSPLWAIQPCLSPASHPRSLRLGWLAGWASGLAGWASSLAGWVSGLAGWASGLVGWPRGGCTDERTDERTDKRMDKHGKSPQKA